MIQTILTIYLMIGILIFATGIKNAKQKDEKDKTF